MEKTNIYKCEICGNIVEVLFVGGGTLTCCGQAMTKLSENTVDAAVEKHVPVVKKEGNKVKVAVGEVQHPMEEKHFIQWIDIITPSTVLRKMLNPGETPEAEFTTDEQVLKAREYCNLHGLWKA